LNALSTAQVIELIEDAFVEHGVAKVVPGGDDLTAAWRSAKAHAEIAKAVEDANEAAERWQNEPAPDDLEDRIRELLELNPEMSWDAALREIIDGEAAP
jgi:hypothetical protein